MPGELPSGNIGPKSAVRPDRRKLLQITAAAALGTALPKAQAASDERFPGSAATGEFGQSSWTSPLKLRAQDDYRASLQAFGGQLSNDIQDLIAASNLPIRQQFSVAIIGSGYGAAICAARLSARIAPGQRICILERGREWIPGTFPDTGRDGSKQVRQKLLGPGMGSVDNPLGLYNIKMNAEINTLSGSGLGGTSLINANVALKPDEDVFLQECWPAALRQRLTLDPYFDRAARMLCLARSPQDLTCKMKSRRLAAEKLNPRPGFFDRSPLAVTYDSRYLDPSGRNPHGMFQQPCTLCGDCITGCNVGAKNTLVTNYLPVAKYNGAEIYTQVEVCSIQATSEGYLLNAIVREDYGDGVNEFPITIGSQLVIVAAGSPGSAEILLQSRSCGMEFSPALGHRWSFNGDTIGFVVSPECRAPIGGVGAYSEQGAAIGPTVQTSLIYNRRPELKHRILVQEAAIPRAVAPIFSLLLQDQDLDHTMVMLGMGHDGAEGKLIWKDDRWQIDWPGLRDCRYRKMLFNDFDELAQAHGGWYKRMRAFGDTLVSVHPLGGCGMSDDPDAGAVNDRGQVYAGRPPCTSRCIDGTAPVHPGLYVADGSVIPTSLGVNPFMTICALSERIADHIVADPQWKHLFR